MRGPLVVSVVGVLALTSLACTDASSSSETATAPPSTAPLGTAGSSPSSTTGDSVSTTVADVRLEVLPFGAQSDNVSLRVVASNVESALVADLPGDVVLSYELDLWFDPAGRSGTVVGPEFTSDGQLAVEAGCVVEGCFDFEPVDELPRASMTVTMRRTADDLMVGRHEAPFVLQFDDGSSEAFNLVVWAAPTPSADISDAVIASTGPPQLVQTVLTEELFAYHAIAAFDSIWVLNKVSGTVSRIDESSGALLATIPVRDAPGGGTSNRLTASSDAVYVAAGPVVRIDPDTNQTTEIDVDVDTAAIIADSGTVWAASLRGPIVRIDADMTVTELGPTGKWVDLAIAGGLIWAVEQRRDGGRLIAFDGASGEIRHDSVVEQGEDGYAVRLVAEDSTVVVGIDTGGRRTGELLIVDAESGEVTDTVALDVRPEGIVLTPEHIWTTGAVVNRRTLEIEHSDFFGFTIARGADGSIWGTGGVPSAGTGEWAVYRYAPGDLAG